MQGCKPLFIGEMTGRYGAPLRSQTTPSQWLALPMEVACQMARLQVD